MCADGKMRGHGREKVATHARGDGKGDSIQNPIYSSKKEKDGPHMHSLERRTDARFRLSTTANISMLHEACGKERKYS